MITFISDLMTYMQLISVQKLCEIMCNFPPANIDTTVDLYVYPSSQEYLHYTSFHFPTSIMW